MKVGILNAAALRAITPAALTAYVRGEEWQKSGAYGQHADVYSGADRPEIVLPRTESISDYASVLSRLIELISRIKTNYRYIET